MMKSEGLDLDFLLQEKNRKDTQPRPDDQNKETDAQEKSSPFLNLENAFLIEDSQEDDLSLRGNYASPANVEQRGEDKLGFSFAEEDSVIQPQEEPNPPLDLTVVDEEIPAQMDFDSLELPEEVSPQSINLDALEFPGKDESVESDPEDLVDDPDEAKQPIWTDLYQLDKQADPNLREIPFEEGPVVEPAPAALNEFDDNLSFQLSDAGINAKDSANDAPEVSASENESTKTLPGSEQTLPFPVDPAVMEKINPRKKRPAETIQPDKKRVQRKFKKRFPISFDYFVDGGTAAGLDIGSNSFKFAQLSKTPFGLKLINCGSHGIPKSEIDETREQTKARISGALIGKLNIKALKNCIISTAISGLEVIFKNIRIPKMKKKEMEKAVPWACRKDFPFPIENTVFEFKKNDGANEKSTRKQDIFVVAAQKKVIANHVEMMKAAKINPSKVSTIPVAMAALFTTVRKVDAEGCWGLVDIGANSSHIAFVKEGQLQFAREISTGGAHFTEALTGSVFVDGKEIELSEKKAEQMKRKYGFQLDASKGKTREGIPLQELSVMMVPVLEKLVSDIQRTREFYEERFRVERVEGFFLMGGGALMKNLCPVLEKQLNCHIEVLNPFEYISLKKFGNQGDLMEMGPRFAVVIGLAIDKGQELNLLPDSLRSSNIFRFFKRVYSYVFVVFALIMLLMSQSISRQINKFQQDFKQANAEYQAAEPKRQKFLSLQKELRELKNFKNTYPSSLDVNLSAADHLKAISNLLPRHIALTSFRISFRKNKNEASGDYEMQELVLLDGVAFENNSMEGINLATFLMKMEKSKYFNSISLKSQTIRDDGSLAFTIECET